VKTLRDENERLREELEKMKEQRDIYKNMLTIPIFDFGGCSRGYLIPPCESALSSRGSESTKRQ